MTPSEDRLKDTAEDRPTENADDLYQALIMDRARKPRHAGALEGADAEADGDNPMCGDRVHLALKRRDDHIVEVRHETKGCAICIAAADLMADAAIGRDQAEIVAMAQAFEHMVVEGVVPDRDDFSDLRALSGVHAYRSRHRCATLPWQALRAALGTTAALRKTGELHHG